MMKYILAGAAFLFALSSLVWGCMALIDYGGDARQTQIELKIQTERAEASEKAKKEILNGIKNLQSIEDKIRKDALKNDRPISPILHDQLDRMRG